MQEKTRTDIFLWLKRPVISEMRAVLKWAYKHASRTLIRYSKIGDWEKFLSDKDFNEIVDHVGRDDKKLFRIILRKRFNSLMFLFDKRPSDILDIGIHCVKIGHEYYYINLYLRGKLLRELKRKFALTEQI